MSSLGAIVAIAVALLLAMIVSTQMSGLANGIYNLSTPYPNPIVYTYLDYLSHLNPIFWLTFIQHVPALIHVNASVPSSLAPISSTISGDATLSYPLNAFIIFPAIALILGGFIAASRGQGQVSPTNRNATPALSARTAIASGALVGLLYAIMLSILSQLFGANTLSILIPQAGSTSAFTLNATFTPSIVLVFIYSLIWGLIFGSLGGWLRLSGRKVLSSALPALSRLRASRMAGAVAGSAAAFLSGIFMFMILLLAAFTFVAASGFFTEVFRNDGYYGYYQFAQQAQANTGFMVFFLLIFGWPIAMHILALAAGAPLSYNVQESATSGIATAAPVSSTSGLFSNHYLAGLGAQYTPQHIGAFDYRLIYLVMLIPIIAYFVGGRVAAKTAGAKNIGSGAVAGLAMSIPLSLLMTACAYLANTSLDLSIAFSTPGISDNSANGSITASLSVLPALGAVFVIVLVTSAIIGALGGLTAVALPLLGDIPRWIIYPFHLLGLPLFKLFDNVTGVARDGRRSAARLWFYDAIIMTIVLGIIVIVLNMVSSNPSMHNLALAAHIAAALLVAVPLLLLTGSLITAFSSPLNTAAVAYTSSHSAPPAARSSIPVFAPPIDTPFQMRPPSQPGYAPQGQMPSQPGYPPQGQGSMPSPMGSPQNLPPSQPGYPMQGPTPGQTPSPQGIPPQGTPLPRPPLAQWKQPPNA